MLINTQPLNPHRLLFQEAEIDPFANSHQPFTKKQITKYVFFLFYKLVVMIFISHRVIIKLELHNLVN